MKIKLFLEIHAWSWLIFGVLAIVVELWRPSFAHYLIPVWAPFAIAGISGLLSKKI